MKNKYLRRKKRKETNEKKISETKKRKEIHEKIDQKERKETNKEKILDEKNEGTQIKRKLHVILNTENGRENRTHARAHTRAKTTVAHFQVRELGGDSVTSDL